MINPELQKYVATSLGEGHDPKNIRHALLAAGWNSVDVDAAFAAAAQGPAAQSPTPAAPAIPAGAVAATPATAGAPARPQAATAGPAAEPATRTEETRLHHGRMPAKKTIAAGIATLLLIILAGGGFAAYKQGWLPGADGASDVALLANLPSNLAAIESATYQGTLEFVSEPREPGARPFDPADYDENMPEFAQYLDDIDNSYSMLPAEIAVRLTAGGSTAGGADDSTDGQFQVAADFELPDFNLSGDVEFLSKDSNLYLRINRFPTLFIDLSALRGRWVVIAPEDLGAAGESFFFDPSGFQEFVSGEREEKGKNLEQMRLLYSMAYEDGVIVAAGPAVAERLENGQGVKRFTLTTATEKVSAFYERAALELQAKYGEDAIVQFDQKTADYLASDAWKRLSEQLKENTAFDVWLDTETGQLARVAYSMRIVPPDPVQKLKDVQYRLKFTLGLTDVNQPVAIEAPADAMSFDDAYILVSGLTREEVLADRQISNIRRIRTALADYHDHSGQYPENLDALLATPEEVYAAFPNVPGREEPSEFFGDIELLKAVPQDAYTKQAYNYRRDGADYVIEYAVDLPEDGESSQYGQVADGVNHATSRTMSREKDPTGSAGSSSFEFSF